MSARSAKYLPTRCQVISLAVRLSFPKALVRAGQHLLIVGESLNSIFVDKIDRTSGAITQGNITALPTMAGTRFTALVPLQ
jgi:hypothetical protein